MHHVMPIFHPWTNIVRTYMHYAFAQARTHLPVVRSRVVVAFAPEESAFFACTCAVIVGSSDEAFVTERLAVVVVVVAAVLMRDATVPSPKDARVIARHRALS